MQKLERHSKLQYMYTGGMLAIGLLILQSFISMEKLDTAAIIAVISFAIAIPSLAGVTIIDFLTEGDTYDPTDNTQKQAGRIWIVGIATALTGTGATFWHILPLAGIIFIIASFLISGTVSRVFMNGIRKAVKDMQRE